MWLILATAVSAELMSKASSRPWLEADHRPQPEALQPALRRPALMLQSRFHRSQESMFERDLAVIGEQITAILSSLGLPNAGEVKWQPTPFAGEWGQGTNIAFQAAAAEAKSGKKVNVPARAQELARLIAEQIDLPAGFARL